MPATSARWRGFGERLGFTRFFQLPADGEPGYVGLRRGSSELVAQLRADGVTVLRDPAGMP